MSPPGFAATDPSCEMNLAAEQDHQEAMDAAWECKHGRLPHDHTPACGCWPQEGARVVQLRPERKPMAA